MDDDFTLELAQEIDVVFDDGSVLSGFIIPPKFVLFPTHTPTVYTQSGDTVWGIYLINGDTVSDDPVSFGYFPSKTVFIELAEDAQVAFQS
jgi:hypothetical protein